MKDQHITGVKLERNGNFKFSLNLCLQLMFDKKSAADEWESVKELYVGFAFKGKITIEEEIETTEKILVATPKSAEVGTLKILDSKGEESIVEQMVLTSFINLQLDSLIGKLSP